jgi:hypothetical protein
LQLWRREHLDVTARFSCGLAATISAIAASLALDAVRLAIRLRALSDL